jgi:hypothetical protein
MHLGLVFSSFEDMARRHISAKLTVYSRIHLRNLPRLLIPNSPMDRSGVCTVTVFVAYTHLASTLFSRISRNLVHLSGAKCPLDLYLRFACVYFGFNPGCGDTIRHSFRISNA